MCRLREEIYQNQLIIIPRREEYICLLIKMILKSGYCEIAKIRKIYQDCIFYFYFIYFNCKSKLYKFISSKRNNMIIIIINYYITLL